jgi:hypothetical protein
MKSYEEYYMEFMDSLFNKNKQKSDKEPIRRKESNPIRRVVFTNLLILNLIFFYGVGVMLSAPAGGMGVFVLIPFGSALALIDLIAVLFYIIKQKPHGVLKIISITAFAILCFMLTIFVIGVMMIMNPNLFMY